MSAPRLSELVESQIEVIRNQLAKIVLNYEIFLLYKERGIHAPELQENTPYHRFFKRSVIAHLTGVWIGLHSLYEVRQDACHFGRLLELASKVLPKTKVAPIEQTFFDKAYPLWRKVNAMRNSLLADRPQDGSFVDSAQDLLVYDNELGELIDLTKRLFDTFLQAWQHELNLFGKSQLSDTLELLLDAQDRLSLKETDDSHTLQVKSKK